MVLWHGFLVCSRLQVSINPRVPGHDDFYHYKQSQGNVFQQATLIKCFQDVFNVQVYGDVLVGSKFPKALNLRRPRFAVVAHAKEFNENINNK
ncbi:unnamed protein product [Prunus armeniaca]